MPPSHIRSLDGTNTPSSATGSWCSSVFGRPTSPPRQKLIAAAASLRELHRPENTQAFSGREFRGSPWTFDTSQPSPRHTCLSICTPPQNRDLSTCPPVHPSARLARLARQLAPLSLVSSRATRIYSLGDLSGGHFNPAASSVRLRLRGLGWGG